ncbi:MAG: hypothetical protein MHM6MM_002157 [Cercozoa sp. M6MM]
MGERPSYVSVRRHRRSRSPHHRRRRSRSRSRDRRRRSRSRRRRSRSREPQSLEERFCEKHEDYEWFRERYHPMNLLKQRAQMLEGIQQRAELFARFLLAPRPPDQAPLKVIEDEVLDYEENDDDKSDSLRDSDFFNFAVDCGPAFLLARKLLEKHSEQQQSEQQSEAPMTDDANQQQTNASDTLDEFWHWLREEVENAEELNDHAADEKLFKRVFDKNQKGTLLDHSLILLYVPVSITQQELEKALSQIDGFESVLLSDPMREMPRRRYAWVRFSDDDSAKRAVRLVKGVRVLNHSTLDPHFKDRQYRNRRAPTAPVVTLLPQRIRRDLRRATRLAEKLNEERGIPESVMTRLHETMEMCVRSPLPMPLVRRGVQWRFAPLERLNIVLEYLRRVHLFEYYTGEELFSERVLWLKYGRRVQRHFRTEHLRGQFGVLGNDVGDADFVSPIAATEAPSDRSAFWQQVVDQRVSARIREGCQFLPPVQLDDEDETEDEEALRDFLCRMVAKRNTTQEAEKKFRCKLCAKAFAGERFVHKHIINKHPEEQNVDDYCRRTMRQLYLVDPDRITNEDICPVRWRGRTASRGHRVPSGTPANSGVVRTADIDDVTVKELPKGEVDWGFGD